MKIYQITLTILIGLFTAGKLPAQSLEKIITGTVTDTKGEILIGVSVSVKSKTTQTITDINGKYRIKAAPRDTLVFSYIGMETKEYYIKNKKEINAILEEKEQSMKEVVVVGYSTQQRKDVTGAISSLKIKDDLSVSYATFDQLLQGKLSGVQVQSVSGNPGTAGTIRIRGVGYINGGNDPLYVIDGIPMDTEDGSELTGLFGSSYQSPLSLIDPSDIESIDVLKDAAAASIYGSRATNGVILITTKKGQSGRTSFSLNMSCGFSQVHNLPEMADTDLYLTVMNEAYNNYNKDNNYNPGDAGYQPLLKDPRGVNYPGDYDWVKLPFREDTPITQRYSLSMRGGNRNTKFYSNISYYDQEGVIKTNRLRRINFRSNIDHIISSKVNFGVTIGLGHTINNRVPSENGNYGYILRSFPQRPYDRPYKKDGSYAIGGIDLRYHNVQAMINESTSDYKIYSANASTYLNWKLAKGLIYKPQLSLLYNTNNDFYNRTTDFPNMESYDGYTRESRATAIRYVLQHTLTYKTMIKEKLGLTAMVGQSYEHYNRSWNISSGWDFPTKQFTYIRSAASFGANGYAYGSTLISHFGRLDLSWDDKYLLAATVRADGSSKFPSNGMWGVFPSASIAWRINKEDFMKSFDFINDWKIRVSWGMTGEQSGVGYYTAQRYMGAEAPYYGQAGIILESPGNRDLSWEKAEQINVGTDAVLFNDRLNISIDYYIKNTHGLLFEKPMPATYGYKTKLVNIGKMRNSGLELSLKSVNIKQRNFEWTSNLTFTTINNKVKKLMEGNTPVYVGNYHILEINKPVGSFYLYKQEGIYQSDKEVPENLYKNGVRAGDMKYALDENGNPKRMITGKAMPDWYGGFTNTFKFYGFDLNISLSYQYGNDILNIFRSGYSDRLGQMDANMLKESAENRWTGPGTSNKYPRALFNSEYNNMASDRYLEDGSFLKLKDITLGYTFPVDWVKHIKLKHLRIYATMQNVATWTKYSGMDPEVSYTLSPKEMGQDFFGTPNPRMYLIGLSLNF